MITRGTPIYENLHVCVCEVEKNSTGAPAIDIVRCSAQRYCQLDLLWSADWLTWITRTRSFKVFQHHIYSPWSELQPWNNVSSNTHVSEMQCWYPNKQRDLYPKARQKLNKKMIHIGNSNGWSPFHCDSNYPHLDVHEDILCSRVCFVVVKQFLLFPWFPTTCLACPLHFDVWHMTTCCYSNQSWLQENYPENKSNTQQLVLSDMLCGFSVATTPCFTWFCMVLLGQSVTDGTGTPNKSMDTGSTQNQQMFMGKS